MGKKKSKSQKLAALAWCWYCDRTFEDQRVLLSHQKAKHFRCSMCPRRLNTAGGLSVHLDQVHKVGTDKIENALPGRESFDVEIYGMEGVPAADLAAWKKRQAEESGVALPDDQHRGPKKPRYAQVALTPEEAKSQLAAHRMLMGLVPNTATVQVTVPVPAAPTPVPAPMAGMPGLPPPPPGFMPPPGFAPPAGMPFPPPFPLPPGMPPPGFMPGMPGFNFPPPPPGMMMPPPGFMPPPGMPLPPQFAPGAPGLPMAPPSLPTQPPRQVREKVPSSSVTLKPGTLLVYGDNDVSPDEKRAKLSQYSLANEPLLAAAPSTAGPSSATGPSDSSAVGSYASVATEGAPGSVVVGEGVEGKDVNGGGEPKVGEIETGGQVSGNAAAAGGGKKRARAADLME